ncbi:MAG: hypothetical protein ACYTBJ_17130, partial [Planctomycetota bacterium]
MKRKSCNSISIVAVGLLLVVCGCGPKKVAHTGFLSDYSKLKAQSDVSARYVVPGNRLGSYSKFIID